MLRLKLDAKMRARIARMLAANLRQVRLAPANSEKRLLTNGLTRMSTDLTLLDLRLIRVHP